MQGTSSETSPEEEEGDDEDAEEPAAQPTSKPRETKPKADTKPDAAQVPLTLVMGIPPELIAALSSLAGTMERIATSVEAQGKAIQALAEASPQHAA